LPRSELDVRATGAGVVKIGEDVPVLEIRRESERITGGWKHRRPGVIPLFPFGASGLADRCIDLRPFGTGHSSRMGTDLEPTGAAALVRRRAHNGRATVADVRRGVAGTRAGRLWLLPLRKIARLVVASEENATRRRRPRRDSDRDQNYHRCDKESLQHYRFGVGNGEDLPRTSDQQ
jgi:hypothetical protein